MQTLLIKNGKVLVDGRMTRRDILIENGVIKLVNFDISSCGPEVDAIDAKNKPILPGGIDPHVHMELPTPAGNSSDDFYTGSVAALAGGTTSFIDFVTPARGESFVAAYLKRKKLAEKSLCDHTFHVSPTWWGMESSREMELLVKEYGITSFKCYMAYQKTVGIPDEILKEVMKSAARLGVLVTLHCEIDEIIEKKQKEFLQQRLTSPLYHALSRPPEAESEAVKRAIHLAAETSCKIYIVHVSTAGALRWIRKARKSGQVVYAETCPQYLLLNEKVYHEPFEKSAPFVISPPLRKKKDNDALWQAIEEGTIDTIGTDHCPFNLHGQKDKGIDDFTLIPNGAGGVEHRLSLLYTFGVLRDRISIERFNQLIAENPATIFGLKNKGFIEPGKDADLLIWNPNKASVISVQTHHQHCDTNIYEGLKVKGMPERVIQNGKPMD